MLDLSIDGQKFIQCIVQAALQEEGAEGGVVEQLKEDLPNLCNQGQ